MKNSGAQPDHARAQGVPFLILSAMVMIIAVVLWQTGFAILIATSVFAFGLFLTGCGAQSLMTPPVSDRRLPFIAAHRAPFILGLIPLAYAIAVAFFYAPNKIRAFMAAFVVFALLAISYFRDAFSTRENSRTRRMDKFYGKVAEAHEALGVEERPHFESVATRSVPLPQRMKLAGGLLKYAPWQLIVAFVLAIALMIGMDFID